MPPRKKRDATPNDERAVDYRYAGEKRTNIPPARMAGEGTVPTVPKARYAYSPHLPPTLQFDPTGEPDQLDALLAKATKGALTAGEAARLREALRVKEPTLEWAGKREQREKGFLEVDPVALHIHERVSARAIIRSALREDVQRDLFADPQQPYKEAVQFYKHDVDWANRLILGDSLQVMSSLARRENLAGKVQMIYMDPPYGIKFSKNIQVDLKGDDDGASNPVPTQQTEAIRAFGDTWHLGVHSYLEFLKQRLLVSRELLADSGSIFVQISDENLHRVRALLDEVFGVANYSGLISYSATTGQTSGRLAQITDYLLWYAKDRKQQFYQPLYRVIPGIDNPRERYVCVETPRGEIIDLSIEQKEGRVPLPEGRLLKLENPTSQSGSERSRRPFSAFGTTFRPSGSRGWTSSVDDGLPRLLRAERLHRQGNGLWWKSYRDRGRLLSLSSLWTDTRFNAFGDSKVYVVQTPSSVIERCILMTTKPGALVLDPTSGGGTTAFAAEKWGRRWIAIDSSRVAVSLARQRLLVASLPAFRVRGATAGEQLNPASGFECEEFPYISQESITSNAAIDVIAAPFDFRLAEALGKCNSALLTVSDEVRTELRKKIDTLVAEKGKKALGETERRRWILPESAFEHFSVPFDVDEAWPAKLQLAVKEYRAVLVEKRAAIEAEIDRSATAEPLIDQPKILPRILRVSGPFTVEGVRPEELSLGQDGLFDGTPNEFEGDEEAESVIVEQLNSHVYLDRMVKLIKQDGLTFLSNQHRRFASVEPLFSTGGGSVIHAEGAWDDEGSAEVLDVAISFGPQYGPVTYQQVEDLLHTTKRHKGLVIAGFSFDADATALIQEQTHPKLRIYQAYIRPDVNPAMDGLLKDTPNSQLFTVFGTPEIEVARAKDGDHQVTLKGVDIYDPVANTVRSTGADKVAAWFLDSDFDGRCFCVTQAFFPDQDAWEKIAKALGSAADADAFEAFRGTTSLPFATGRHKRIAVKVIDPRGNEVMVVRALEA
jgi:adenine-specific DNA-methyltransferase